MRSRRTFPRRGPVFSVLFSLFMFGWMGLLRAPSDLLSLQTGEGADKERRFEGVPR